MANPIADALSSIAPGSAITFRNLTMVPLVGAAERPAAALDYLVLDDAMALGLVEITEVSEQGSVPDLRVINKGAQPVLVVDGEELVGAKQNRVVNLTILLPANSDLVIPVSCVEAGRWRSRGRAFAAAPRAQYATGRAKKMAQVTASMWTIGEHRSDQAQVWDDIAEKSARLGASSPTSAMEALFTTHSDSIEEYVAACRPVDRQRGALFLLNGRTVGFDLFDRASTLSKVLPKLVRSVGIDALDSASPSHTLPDQRDLARLFLSAVASAPAQRAKAVGLGDDLRVTAPGLTGAALVTDSGLVHVSAFAT